MSAAELIQRVADRLVVDQAFAPIERVAPGCAGAAGRFDACVARLEAERLDVHAFLAWRQQDVQELSWRAETLRLALEDQTPHYRGRVHATFWLVCNSQVEEAQALLLAGMPQFHFLARVVLHGAIFDLAAGRALTHDSANIRPASDVFEEYFSSRSGSYDAEAVLAQREAEEQSVRKYLGHTGTRATYVLIALNVGVFLMKMSLAAQLAGRLSQDPDAQTRALADVQAMIDLGANDPALTLGKLQLWRLLGAMFLHADLVHLVMNMMALLSLGALMERFAGPWRLLVVYLGAGLLGGLLSAWQSDGSFSVGASGAILGLAGALLTAHWRRPRGFPKALAERLYGSLLKPVAFIFLLGITLSWLPGPLRFDNWGHFGGLLGGAALAWAFPALLGKSRERL